MVELATWSTREASVDDRPATGVEAAAQATGTPGDSPKLGDRCQKETTFDK